MVRKVTDYVCIWLDPYWQNSCETESIYCLDALHVGHSECQQPEQIQNIQVDKAAHHTEAGHFPDV